MHHHFWNVSGNPTLTNMVVAQPRPLNSNWRRDMKSLLTTATLAIGLALPAVAQIDLDKFRSVLNTVDTNKDGKISQSEFMTACQKGELKNIQL